MMQSMMEAKLGDDVFGDDPTVNALQRQTAQMTGHEAGLFFPSGTQSNLVALLCHCERGDEYIVAQSAHAYKYEGGGAAVLGSIQPQPIERRPDGTLDLNRVESVIKADDIHFAKTRLLALENTTTEGSAVSMDYIKNAADLCQRHGLYFHLDGARLFNAAAALGIDAAEIARPFHSVSVCLSKGLGAPVGSVLCGSRELIDKATRWRKVVGGGMRQSGVLAAAGLYALEHNIERLEEDHILADYLVEQLGKLNDVEIMYGGARTNMVFFNLVGRSKEEFEEFGRQKGVLFAGHNPARMVTHKDVSRDQIDIAIDRLSGFFS
jgi:threonine aldolase